MTRSQADDLERCLSARSGAAASAEVEAWSRLAGQLRAAAPRPTPRHEFRDQLRIRLLAEAADIAPARRAATARTDTSAVIVKDGARLRRASSRAGTPPLVRRALAGVLVSAALAGGSAAVASTGSVPGDPLYGVKRAVEVARLDLAPSRTARASVTLGQARERLEEAEELAGSTSVDAFRAGADPVTTSLKEFRVSSSQGLQLLREEYAEEGDVGSLAEVGLFVRDTLPALERLRAATPTEVHPVIDGLVADLLDVDHELAAVAACGGPCADGDPDAAQSDATQSDAGRLGAEPSPVTAPATGDPSAVDGGRGMAPASGAPAALQPGVLSAEPGGPDGSAGSPEGGPGGGGSGGGGAGVPGGGAAGSPPDRQRGSGRQTGAGGTGVDTDGSRAGQSLDDLLNGPDGLLRRPGAGGRPFPFSTTTVPAIPVPGLGQPLPPTVDVPGLPCIGGLVGDC